MAICELQRLLPAASGLLCEILGSQQGACQAPVRAEIFGPQRFAQHGRSLGATHSAERSSAFAASFFPRLRSNILVLRQAHRYIGERAKSGYDISPAAEWLLDNFHLIEAQLKEVHEGLPRSYFRALPVLLGEPLAGLPRIYGVAWAFVAHTDGAFDEDLLLQFLAAYQETRELSLREIWALPTTLRVVLVENLRRLAERVATNKAAREVANLCFDRLDSFTTAALDELLSLLNRRGVGRVFLAQMAQRMQDQRMTGERLSDTRRARWLSEALPDLAAAQVQQTADQTADNLSVSNALTSLRAIGDADWPEIVAHSSSLMHLMMSAPVFAAEHIVTRDQSLHAIERLARLSGRSEVAVAQALLGLMGDKREQLDQSEADACHWLHGAGRPALLAALGLPGNWHQRLRERLGELARLRGRRLALPLYLAALACGSLGLVAWLLPAQGAWTLAALLMMFPASEAVVAVINRLISESARPSHLPRLALAKGLPPEHRVMVVVPAMLSSAAAVTDLVHRLHLHYLANPEAQAQFALLSDWLDAPSTEQPTDQPLLELARAQLTELNLRHPPAPALMGEPPALRFLLLHRQRRFSPTEQAWIGWERKRGKLEQLVHLLAEPGAQALTEADFIDLGELSRPQRGTRYIVTLDSDTQLPPGRLRELVGIAAHPHNQPRLDPGKRFVVQGYGILQPRVVTPLPAPKDFTLYHWFFAGQCGIDPYSAASSEVYQDLFLEGSFSGKGLLHVQAMHAVLNARLPEGQVLSHDLLEGALARCAAVSDITVVEDAPFHADVAASRVHRWTRGDWQLLPILLTPWRYPFHAVSRWKMFDNLRRSLVAPMSLALLVLALWPAAGLALSPWAAFGLVWASLSAGPLLGALAGFAPSRDDLALRHFYTRAAADLLRALLSGLWMLGQLLQQAWMALDAVLRALYRMLVSRRLLLQWTTAAAAQAAAKTTLPDVLRQHWRAPLLALLLWAGLLFSATGAPWLASLLCLAWLSAPLASWWVSRPNPACEQAILLAPEQDYLAGIARDTWRFFERCIGPGDRYLPPDNLQLDPHEMLAHRTSPTNIGLYLLATACAREFGWIGTQELLNRLEATLASMAALERHRGHFLNWYDTERGEALLPRYVSTVDSGNLCGHLLAAAVACRTLASDPWAGQATTRALQAAQNRLKPLLAARCGGSPVLRSHLREQLRWCLADLRATRRSAALDMAAADKPAAAGRLLALAAAFERLALEADFKFLYHPKRHLFHIGYRIAEQQLDSGFYDLLASESRLTSLFAVAKGDVPVRHWGALGRPFFAVAAAAGLRSWSGSMFEYLMPSLVLDEPHGSVLREACLAALQEQMHFAAQNDTPWGISESAYAGRDFTLAYQYAPQGVPRLALRRTPIDELVIAPYATALAAQIAPLAACRNFEQLEALGPLGPLGAVRGRYGFIEALDYSPARQAGSARFTPVSTLMAHHQGMSIVALANVLLGGVAQRWGMAPAQIEAVASLLHERAPREVSVLFEPPQGWVQQSREARAPSLLREVLPGETAVAPTHLLSNGRYSVSLRANGAGWSRWGRVGISRWRDDALRDALGSFFYLRGLMPASRPGLVSITQHPAPDPAAQYRSTFHADTVCFEALWPQLRAQTTVWVSPEDDIEFRQIELRNLSDRTLEFELISAFEVTLAEPRADEAHPAFSNLFLRAEWQAEDQALLFERKPRLATEQGLLAAHFLADGGPHLLGLRCQTDRQHWLGRNRPAGQPLADFETPAPGEAGAALEQRTGLDPVCALAARVRIGAQAKVVLTFATAACDNRAKLDAIIDKYRQPSHVQRATLMSATLTGIRLRTLGLSAENLAALQSVTTALVLSLTRPMSSLGTLGTQAEAEEAPTLEGAAPAICDRRLLWRFGISGDKPLILVSAGMLQGLGLLRTMAKALRLWSWGGVACDLVIINAEPSSYLMTMQRELMALRERHLAENQNSASAGRDISGLHVLRADELSDAELNTLRTLACLRLHADGRPLVHHIADWLLQHEQALDARLEASMAAVGPETSGVRAPSLQQFQGQFGDHGSAAQGEFKFEITAHRRPLRPWINVLANRDFGAQISEAGGGYSWALNSRMNQLTPWSNDPVADPPSEWFLLQDLSTLATWSVAPGAWSPAELSYELTHGQGFSVIKHRRGDLAVTATWCVDALTSVKQVQLDFVNHGSRNLSLRVVGMVEWLLGANRSDRSTLLTKAKPTRASDRRLNTLLATQRERAQGFGDGTAFFALAAPAAGQGGEGDSVDWTCDRREFFDARGRLVLPDFLCKRQGAGLDPCAALSTQLLLAPGASTQRVYLLGYGANPAAALQLAEQAGGVPAAQRLSATRASWDELLGATQLATPDPLFDALVNRWLLYQTLACRLWAKAGFYQAGGATGFRDQLQDAMALAWAAPELLRQQIVLCASRQFVEGDVQHWWHSPQGAGVRTHFSDDLLWLPLACAHYLRCSGDLGLLAQSVHFLDGAQIPPGAEDAYYTPTQSLEAASVYEHAARTIDRSLRVGVHGLPLMGSGDWNDGMNRVGIEGRGESVWLGWFLCRVVADFAPLARERGEASRAASWETAAQGWRVALLGPAWDGQWFKRAFFDNGEPLGSGQNRQGRIDLIAQAWSVLSGAAPLALQRIALGSAQTHLVDADAGLLRLLDPPLVDAIPSAGYIQAYPPGVRENGGQYSHAGVWALMARAQLAQQTGAAEPEGVESAGDAVYRYFSYLSPAHRAADAQRGPVYGLEPYVLAGDVYSQPPYVGRGGWSWYTGAAAWLHRAAIESLCGLQLEARRLVFRPCLPGHWPRVELTLTRQGRRMRFVLLRCTPAEALDTAVSTEAGAQLLLPGQELAWTDLPAQSDFVIPLLAPPKPAGAAAHNQAGHLPTAAGEAR
jgi:cyclic beta-1,2-glucan synthetase